MIILDANIFIYLADGTLDRRVIAAHDVAYASITQIEVLGYSRIQAEQMFLLQGWLAESYRLELTGGVIELAVRLRQQKRMSLGDAITAATALETDSELWTANVDDFKHIDGLKLVNPLTPASRGKLAPSPVY